MTVVSLETGGPNTGVGGVNSVPVDITVVDVVVTRGTVISLYPSVWVTS